MAIDDGYIVGPEQPVLDLFPSRRELLKDAVSGDLKLKHLLTMTTGLDAHDSYLYGWKGLLEMGESDNWVLFALTRDQIYKPGEHFDYSNQATFVVGASFRETAGLGADEYARVKLFEPLGITSAKWEYTPDGTVEGWGGLWLTASDLAKFAWFILQKGQWNGEQLVSESWIETAVSPHVTANTLQAKYGYMWWIADARTIMALGYSGQYAIIVPEDNLVVVFLSDLPDSQFYYPEQMYRFFLKQGVSDELLPENRKAMKKLEKLAAEWE